MDEEPKLTLAKPEDVAWTLAFGLRFDGRKRVHHADDMMANIAAAHLVKCLEQSGFVVMRKPPASAPSTSAHLPLLRLKE